jgi:hypothetical protein
MDVQRWWFSALVSSRCELWHYVDIRLLQCFLPIVVQFYTIYDTIRYGTVGYGRMRCGAVLCCATRYGMIYDTV